MFPKIRNKLDSNPKATFPAKTNHGFLPHINNKGQPSNVPVHQDRYHDQRPITSESRTGLESVSEHVNTWRRFNRQERKRPQLPMTPTDVLEYFGDSLTDFELDEITQYSEIWYMGQRGKKVDGSCSNPQNSGNADESGTNTKVIHDHIDYRYQVLKKLGEGSFGQVFKCLDHKTNEMVALKIIRDKRTYRAEVKILKLLRRKDRNNSYNVVHMKNYFYFRDHLCIVYELLGPSLHQHLKRNRYKGFSKADVRCIAKDLVRCLRLLEKERIIHCDLKPDNIVMSPKGQGIKVIDFGGSCFEHKKWYPCIQTLLYSAPEVLMGQPYTSAIDMWSLGCILAELYTGLPLFPGEDSWDQILRIIEVLGMPPDEFIPDDETNDYFFDFNGQPRKMRNRRGRKIRPGSKYLESILKSHDLLFLDFIKRCLMWSPEMRLTPEEAMQHGWLQEDCYESRARTRTLRKRTECNDSMDNHTKLPYLKVADNKTVGQSMFHGIEKFRRAQPGFG